MNTREQLPAPSEGRLRKAGGDDLIYFTHEIDGRLYGGWFRRGPKGRIEVFARGQIRTTACGTLTPEAKANAVLEEIVRSLAPRPNGTPSHKK